MERYGYKRSHELILRVFTTGIMILIMIAAGISGNCDQADVYADSDDGSYEKITVYLTISDDSEYITGNDSEGTVLARVPVELTYKDLADYGLSEFRRYEADDYAHGGGYLPGGEEVKEPTLLMLMLKAAAAYYYGDPDMKDFVPGEGFTCEGTATHLFIDKFFGHDLNLMYFIAHRFPKQNETTGATADYVLLSDGDTVDIAMFSDYDFNQHGGFARFMEEELTGETGRKLSGTLVYTPTVPGDDQPGDDQIVTDLPMAGEKIRISKDHGRTWQDSGCVTREDGSFDITFFEPGEYLLSAGPKYKYMSDRGITKACIAPPTANVTVRQAEPSEEEAAEEQEDRMTVMQLLSDIVKAESSLLAAKAEFDPLAGEYEAEKHEMLTAKDAYEAVRDEPSQAAIRAAEDYREHAARAKAAADEMVSKAAIYRSLAESYSDKAGQALDAAEKWLKSSAIVSSAAYKDALAAYDNCKEAVTSAKEYLTSSQRAEDDASGPAAEAAEYLTAAEAAVSDAVRAKEEADARKSKEEKAADDLMDALELQASYVTLRSELDDSVSAMDDSVSAYQACMNNVGELISEAEKLLVDPGSESITAAKNAKMAAAELRSALEQINEKAGSARNDHSEAVRTADYLGTAAHKALESNSEISEDKKAEAQAIVDTYKAALIYLETTDLHIRETETLQETESLQIEQMIKDAEDIYEKAVAAELQIKEDKAAAAKLITKKVKVSTKKRKFTVSWSKVKGTDGYQVQYKLRSAKKFRNLKTLSKTKVKTKKLRKGKKYVFRVRTYKKVAGTKIFGRWKKSRTVKCR